MPYGFSLDKQKIASLLKQKFWPKHQERNQWFDSVSGLPYLNTIWAQISEFFASGWKLGLFYIDLTNFSLIQHMYGRTTCDAVLRNVGRVLLGMPIKFFGYRQKISVCTTGGDDFLIFFDSTGCNGNFEDEFVRFHQRLEENLNKIYLELGLDQDLKVHLGYAEVPHRDDHRLESLVYSAIKQATLMAKGGDELSSHSRKLELQRIILEQSITMVYQPIVSLRSQQLLGFEALARGPVDSFFTTPNNLFTYAEKFNMLYQLETLCREKAILSANSILDGRKLFININPQVVNDPNFKRGRTRQILQDAGIDPLNVVLELTERSAIEDYNSFKAAIEYYRKQGFLLGIDDVGAGYSNLQTVAELRPEYMKIDMSLVRGVDASPAKKALLETIAIFAQRINTKTVAEGIETIEELKALLEIGIDFGQGYLFARPSQNGGPINLEPLKLIQDNSRENKMAHSVYCSRIGDLAANHKCILPSLTVRQVTEIFNAEPYLYGVVVCSEKRVHGLIMRPKLFSTLGTQYGYALFMHRFASEILDPNPLIVPAEMPVSLVAHLVAGRTDDTIDDYIIVTKDNAYYGVVAVRRLLESMAKIQIEQARNANPLTGLPGNLVIEGEISKRLNEGSVFSVLYLDLDNFKSFNDKYGFEHGDRVIRLTADIIAKVVDQHGTEEDLVGHIGGDDFVVVTEPARATQLAEAIIECFDADIPSLYTPEDRLNGFITTVNRQMEPQKIPLMTISIAVVSNKYRHITSHLELGEIAAELKRLAKRQPGSVCCQDYRQDKGSRID